MFEEEYHYILIWGHGMKFLDEILKEIYSDDRFAIEYLIECDNIPVDKLVKQIYSYDYAPFSHLQDKVKYLLSTPKKVMFIFIKVFSPDNEFLAEGRFRHLESKTVKDLKEKLRNRFNPRANNLRTEEHVVHGSDSEAQADYILKFLGYRKGVDTFRQRSLFEHPFYIKGADVQIKKISFENLMASILEKQDQKVILSCKSIYQTPHYLGLTLDMEIYRRYINDFRGKNLRCFYTPEKFSKLADDFDYLSDGFSSGYIFVEEKEGRFIILDGLHRAAILASRKIKETIVCQIMKN